MALLMDTGYLKNIAVYVLTALISALVIAYIVIQLVGSFGDTIETTAAVYVTERSLAELEAYVIRDETIIYSPVSGTVNYLYSNGTKVGADAVVADVFAGSADISAQIISIDKKIELLQNSNVGQDMVIADTATLDSRITLLYTTIADKLSQGDVSYAIRSKDELLTLLNRRGIMVKTVSDYNTQIEALQAQREALTASLGSDATEITTDVSGYFYNAVDGYESAFSAVDIDTLTISGFHELIASEPDESSYYKGSSIPIGKVAEGYAWYIACEIPYTDSYNYTVGGSYTIIYPYSGDDEFKATLYRTITEPNSDRAVLIFKNGIVRSSFNFLRSQTIEVVETSYSGYRVPISAVRIVDGVKGVYVLSGSVVEFRTINPIFEKNGYLIVEERDLTDQSQTNRLNIYEQIIVGGGDYYDGQLIG